MPRLGAVLRALDFLTDYQLVVSRAGRVESWMGPRRVKRLGVDTPARLGDGEPTLLDLEGDPVVSLWPLAQVAEPAPGAPAELFLLEGRGRHGARLWAAPVGFERQDEAVWDWLGQHVLPAGEDTLEGAGEAQAPYRGLSAFSADDAALFFGRERQAEAFLNRLRVTPFLAVVGPSGAGKSSFVQAGVIPSLPPGWQASTLRPGPAPLAALEARLAALDYASPTLIVVDQLEELFTLCGDPAERLAFVRALTGVARSVEDPHRVVVTLRDDFLVRAEALPPLRDRLAQGLQLLSTPAPDDLLRILVEPARRAGYEWDDPDLPRQMVDQVAEKPGALALLSFTAARVWELRDRHFRQLRRKAYDALGGVGGALAGHAEETLAGLPAEEQRLVREAFRRLVTAEGTRAVLRRDELVQVLGSERVVEKLVAARLVVVADTDRGETIEIVHEALLDAWPRLLTWRREDAEGARLRDQLRSAARQWHERGRPLGLVWRDDALAEYGLWRARYPGQLTDEEEAFAAASLGEDAKLRRRRRWLAGGAVLALVAGLVLVTTLYRRARASAADAREQLVKSYEEQGRQHMLAGDANLGLLYLAEAYRDGARDPALRYLLGRAVKIVKAQLASLPHGDLVSSVQFSADGRRLLTASWDGTAALWDAAGGERLVRYTGHGDKIHSAALSPDGATVATASWDGSARLWDAASGRPLHVLPHQARVYVAAFSPDGTRLVTCSRDKTAAIWDAHTGARLASLSGHTAQVDQAAWSADGRAVLTGAQDGTARVWDAQSGAERLALPGHAGKIIAARWSADGRRILTAAGPVARLWDAATGETLATITHQRDVVAADLGPRAERILTCGKDGVARVSDAAGKLLMTLDLQGRVPSSGRFSGDGERIAVGASDGHVRLWDARGLLQGDYSGHTGDVSAIAFGPERRLLTGSGDGSAKLWELQNDLVAMTPNDGSLVSFDLSEDGRTLALGFADGSARHLDLETGATTTADDPVLTVDGTRRRLVAGGRTLATVEAGLDAYLTTGVIAAPGADGVARLWRTDGSLLASLGGHGGPVRAIAPRSDLAEVATGCDDKLVRVWRLGVDEPRLRLAGHTRPVIAVAFDRSGTRLGSGSLDTEARVWDTRTGDPISVLRGHAGVVTSVAFLRDGELVVTTGDDDTVRFWDEATGKPLRIVRRLGLVGAVTDDLHDRVAVLDGRALEVWEGPALPRLDEIDRLLRCRVPYRLDRAKLQSATLRCD